MTEILLLEDDEVLCDTIAYALNEEGYLVETARSIEEAIEATYEGYYALYLFDINLDDGNAIELLQALREAQDFTPVIFITALQDLNVMAKSFELGALYYLKKPFELEELLIRVGAKLSLKPISYGNIVYDEKRDIVTAEGKPIELGPVQHAILVKLLKSCGQPVPKESLYECLDSGSDNALRVAVAALKRKLNLPIRNIRGRGYMLEAL